MRATLYVYDKPGVSSEGTRVAEANGDTLRRVLSNLADHPGVRTAPGDFYIKVDIQP